MRITPLLLVAADGLAIVEGKVVGREQRVEGGLFGRGVLGGGGNEVRTREGVY